MRLRLIIQRNELPLTCVVWFMPPDCSPAQLLINLNNVIPLESDNWALEDYVVEVPGHRLNFELLHYEQLSYVLEDDNEVVIRPLHAAELKERRISGRHQISRDGKHLVDGVPFGKPLQRRRIDRPPVTIPPRRRGPYELDDQDGEESWMEWDGRMPLDNYDLERSDNDRQQLLLDADFGEDDSEDGNFEPAEDEDEDDDFVSEQEADTEEDESMRDAEGGDQDSKPDQHGAEGSSHRKSKNSSHKASFPRPSIRLPPAQHGLGGRIATNSESSDIEGDEENMDPLLGYYDHHGLPKGSIDSGMALHHMAGVLESSTTSTRKPPKAHIAGQKSVRFAADMPRDELSSTPSWDIDPVAETEAEEDEEGESNDASSSDVSSTSEESDNSGDSEASSSDSDSNSEHAESSSDSSSDDDSAPEEESSKTIPQQPNTLGDNGSMDLTDASKLSIPPGEGRKQTKARNVRRRNSKVLLRMKENGILPNDTTAAEFSKLHVNVNTSKEDAMAALEAIRSACSAEKDLDFTARRQRLLDSLQPGGIEVGGRSSEAEAVQDSIPEAPAQSTLSTPVEPAENTAAPRRAKLDLGAGRRLLFGALGIKNPKTKQDEEKLRKDLMKDVRPLITPKPASLEPAVDAEDADGDPEAWRESIIYRAVECCHDDVQLSEPPFPFVQRWDPQQQGGRGKRKKEQRDDPQFYDSTKSSKRQKTRKGRHGYTEEQEYLDASYEPSYEEDFTALDYDDAEPESNLLSETAGTGVISQSQDGAEEADNSQDPADLAPLPEDPSLLPNLIAGHVATGMTIAFKQLVMSEETKWQPQISAYRTAIVIANPGDGALHLTLALRDRKQPSLNYDEATGNRIYGRFDMPVDEEDDEDFEDDGMLNLQFSELIEPKIVQDAPDNLPVGTDMNDVAPTGSVNSDDPNAGKQKAPVEEQFSHVTETPLHSEVPESHSPSRTMDQQEQNRERPVRLIDETENAAEMETISDEAREEISHLMKEAGFRSSVPSSIQKDIYPNRSESPGDTAVVEKLMNDMAEVDNHFPSSPKFNGFGSSSPTRQQQPLSSPVPPQSSWQTIPFDEPSSPPAVTQAEELHDESPDALSESWETINPSVLATKPSKPKSKKRLHKASSIQKANLLWEQLSRQAAQSSNGGAPADNAPGLPEQPTQVGADSVNEQGSNGNVQYPKLSIGSSFTSQISDHGRQPDAVFEDSTTLDGDLTKPSAGHSSATRDNNMGPLHDITVVDPDLPSHSAEDVQTAKEIEIEDPQDLSSDDPFPPIEVMLSQRTPRASREEREDDEGNYNQEPTPKASGAVARTPRRSASQPNTKTRTSGPRSSQTPASQKQPKNFVVPEGSQVMDLTLLSDAEADQDALDTYVTPFRRYKLAEDDDDAYEDSADNSRKGGGWVKKKASSQTDSPKRTGKRLRSSSQASATPRSSRKKATPKF